ncbi:MAG: hypothetical protein JO235_25890 [Chroococcidiopsidaceae cyanobacterium CP_BM_RX_35]|nr:hypothetical protein [Chroococcidiopsidaceae cyanobacterium CP_BM_RX_35]
MNNISSEQGLSHRVKKSSDFISHQERNGRKLNSAGKAITGSTVQPIENGLQVVHAMPGRIRLRTTNTSCPNLLLDALTEQLQQQDGITEVCSNQETGSLLVKYDRNKLSLQQIFEGLKQFSALLPKPLQPEEDTELFAAWRSFGFWQEQGRSLIPLVTGLLVTGRLGLHGLTAIPVYLVAAGATRQVLEYLESESGTSEQDQIPQTSQRLQKLSATEKSESAKMACSVVHKIPGRVRFHVPMLAQDRAYTQRLEVLLRAEDQLKSYRINRNTATVVITYEPGWIPDDQVLSYSVELIQLACSVSPRTEPKVTDEQAIKSASPWVELKHPALAASLAYMANLPV